MSAFSTLAGFSNPVDDAQRVFRATLQAFSRPGIPVPLPVLPPPLPCGRLSQGMLALALTLCDSDTPLWLNPAEDTPEARHHLRFHCAAPFAAHTAGAAFALISRPEEMPRLNAFNLGRADFPDRSTTLVIRANLSAAEPVMELTGPGVKGHDHGFWQPFHIGGLPAWFWADWAENHAAYPLGVDVVFVEAAMAISGEPSVSILGLPRTTRVRPAGNSPLARGAKERGACM